MRPRLIAGVETDVKLVPVYGGLVCHWSGVVKVMRVCFWWVVFAESTILTLVELSELRSPTISCVRKIEEEADYD